MGILLSGTFNSCKKFVEVPPPKNQLVSATVFSNNITATSAMAGIYSNMIRSSGAFGGAQSIASLGGMSADELINYSSNQNAQQVYNTSINPTNTYTYGIWKQLYQTIYESNAVLEGVANSNGVSAGTRQQLQGEAKFLRAFCFFYLTNLFGEVPLTTTTNYLTNDQLAGATQQQVYHQIIADLLDAQALLSDSYVSSERIRPNKAAATALLARVYLYTKDWQDAVTQATAVINDPAYTLVPLNQVFLKNSQEAIWQMQPVLPGYNTFDGQVFILTTAPTNYSLTGALMHAFENGDNRKTNWTDSIAIGSNTYYFPYKYKIKTNTTVTEYYTVLRLAEQYLIRAEARAQLNDVNGAEADLNMIRNRAGLPNTTAATGTDLLNAIQQERRVEFFTEWGHRWLDLKRTGQADAVLGNFKSNWKTTGQLYPIPQQDVANDHNLKQNAGY